MDLDKKLESSEKTEIVLSKMDDETPISEVEKEIIEKENKRLKHNSYHREYYKNNKEKYNKHVQPGRKRGQRGGNKNLRYKLSILNEETGNEMLSENYKTLQDIADVLQLPRHTVSMICRGKYQSGMGKQKKTKEYSRYKIEKL